MKFKHTSVLILICFVLLFGCCLASCSQKGGGNVIKGGENSFDVSTAMHQIYNSMDNCCTLSGAVEDGSVLYVAFNGFAKTDDSSLAVNEKATLFDFSAKIKINPSNTEKDTQSVLSFTVKEDISGANCKFELYYKDGTLYINYSPTLVRVAIKDFNLAKLTHLLYNSRENGGKVKTTADQIEFLGNYLFSDCVRVTDGQNTKYQFTVDFNQLASAFEKVLTNADIGLTSQNVMDILGLDSSAISKLSDGSAKMVFNTVKKNGMEIFQNATYDHTKDTVNQHLEMTSFVANVITDEDAKNYEVILADSISSFNEYNFANYDLAGTISLDVSSVNASSLLFGDSISLGLSLNSFRSSYSFKSNYSKEGGFTALLSLFMINGTDKKLDIYYAQNSIYLDASDFIGAEGSDDGYLKITELIGNVNPENEAENKEDSALIKGFRALGMLAEAGNLSGTEVVSIISQILAKRVSTENSTAYIVNTDTLSLLLKKVGINFPMKLNSLSILLNTESSSFKRLDINAKADGFAVSLSADTPKIGFEVAVIAPAWLSKCVDLSNQNQILTPVLSGQIVTNLSGISQTDLVERLIKSLSGKQVELEGEISSFKASANYAVNGALKIFQIDFFTAQNNLVTTFYYNAENEQVTNDVSNSILYVIMPEKEGLTKVYTLALHNDGRYGDFVNLINGNLAVEGAPASMVISNNQKGFTYEFNTEGFNRFLSQASKVLPGLMLKALPVDLSLENLSITIGENSEIKGIFAGNKYINLKIDSFRLSYHSLSLATDSIPLHANRTVSIYDNNDMAAEVDVVLNDDVNGRSMRVSASDFGGWVYEKNEDESAADERIIIAYLPVFGKRVRDNITVDYSEVTTQIKVDSQYAGYLNNETRTFSFDRYNCKVDPLALLSDFFNIATVTTNPDSNGKTHTTDKAVFWTVGNNPLYEATFSIGSDSYTITPNITNFFGDSESLDEPKYTIMLLGSKAEYIENNEEFLTISAYSNPECDPLSAATYHSVKTEVVLADTTKIEISDLEWDISSIDNIDIDIDGKKLSNEKLITELNERFYMLSGKFKLSAWISNCLGAKQEYKVNIIIQPKQISSVIPLDLLDGVSFISSDKEGDTQGVFVIDPFKLNKLDSTVSLAKKMKCSYNGSVEDTEIDTIKWQVKAVSDVPIKSENDICGSLSIQLGNNIGGFQKFTFDYRFLSYNAKKIAIFGYDKTGRVQMDEKDYNSLVSFDFLNCNPYSYVYPKDVEISYDKFSYIYNDTEHSVEAGKLSFNNVDWKLSDWNENHIWQKGPDFVYSGMLTVCGLQLNINLSFQKREIESWDFLDAENNIATSDISKPIVKVQHYVQAPDGAFMLKDGKYVAYIEGTQTVRYILDTEKDTEFSYVYYGKPNPNDINRLIIDPNTTEYKCVDSYPAFASVKFYGVAEKEIIPIVWDLSNIYKATSIMENGYHSNVTAYLPYAQEMAKVDLWISGTNPNSSYVKPSFVGDGDQKVLSIENSTNRISLSLFGLKEGKLVINDLRTVANLHSAICGCGDANCLGRLYFYYADENIKSGFFDITSWQGLEQVSELFSKGISEGKPIEQISGDFTLIAKVGNISCPVTLSIEQSVVLNQRLSGIPYANSSIFLSEGGYSMVADGLSLTIDPYLSSPIDSSFYPTTLSFVYKGEDGTATFTGWDYSVFMGKQLHTGHNGTVYALIDTPFGVPVKISISATVIARYIDLVTVDGSTLKRIYIDCYSDQPFGQNVENENGRTFAYKSVSVKFRNDDNRYSLSLKYDITDYTASYSGALIDSNATVYVGNTAGGYQSIGGYAVYSKQNIVLSAVSSESAVTDLISGGEVFRETPTEKVFHIFAETENDNKAWEALTVSGKSLTLQCGYYIPDGEGFRKDYRTLVATEYSEGKQGLVYNWERRNTDGKDYMFLQIWYQSELYGSKLGEKQEICTNNEKFVTLNLSLFSVGAFGLGLTKEYDSAYTFQKLIAEHPISSINNAFPNSQILYTVKRGETEYQQDKVLDAGEYVITVTLDNSKYTGSITLNLTITQKEITQVTVMQGNNPINSDPYITLAGVPIIFSVSCSDKVSIKVVCTDSESNTVDKPYLEGIYTLSFLSLDDNYICNAPSITLQLKAEE